MRTDKYVMGFGDRLYQAIQDKGLNKQEFEKKIGLKGKGGVNRYMYYNQMPSAFLLAKMSVVLGVTADWLLGLNCSTYEGKGDDE